ncbi:MAG: glycogen synthase [Chlamydiales bacterium]|nr:glycogen synthase [Chlamydiales bacterium]
MRIVHIAAEFAPIAKAGGLGEVVTGLCRQLTLEHEEVDIILPKYSFISDDLLGDLKEEPFLFPCKEQGVIRQNKMWSAEVENCRLHLLETDHPSGYFRHPHIYGYPDDLAKFIYFSKAALEYLKLKNEPIDVLHLHEWHTALCALLAKEERALDVRSIMFTIHNLEYQGKCLPQDLDAIGLSGEKYLQPDLLQDDASPHNLNLLKAGIVYSDAIVAVSPTYAQEIQTPFFGCHLQQTLIKHKAKLFGILNGIDQKLWNPAEDPNIAAHFAGRDTLSHVKQAKQLNKKALAKQFHLDATKSPWIGVVARLVPQKGPELIEEAIHYALENDAVFLLLGSSPIGPLQEHFQALKERYQHHPQLLLELSYNEALAHQIYAASDFTLVPSHFEPCGLTQLIAMRYAAIPIVRATGGLKDTVFDCEDYNIPHGSRNGFTFSDPKELIPTLQRAFELYNQDPATFQSLIRRALQADYSWKKPAAQYLKIYSKLVASNSKQQHVKITN